MGVDKIKISVQFDTLHKSYVNKEETIKQKWKKMYGWMPKYYDTIKDELHQVSEESEIERKLKDPRRSLLRCPKTSTGMVGWIASIDEFKLQTFGPDHMTGDPLLPDNHFW